MTVTSLSPTSGSTFGNTVVTIKGSGFTTCIICSPAVPPAVLFGGMPAAAVRIIDSETLEAVTARSLPATVTVTVYGWNGLDPAAASAPQSFTFNGPPALEPILMPIYSAPVRGAFGSEFITTALATNRSQRNVHILGVDTTCLLATPILDPAAHPQVLQGFVGNTKPLFTDCSTWPGRLLWVPPQEADLVSFSIRVHDTSRNADSHGTEVPVVRLSDFSNEPIVLAGVPVDPRFRALLRIYAPGHIGDYVTVRVGPIEETVLLQQGRTIFEPAYATFNTWPVREQLPAGQETFTVTVIPPPERPGSPPIASLAMWAFITVTNNTTQEITTITPDM